MHLTCYLRTCNLSGKKQWGERVLFRLQGRHGQPVTTGCFHVRAGLREGNTLGVAGEMKFTREGERKKRVRKRERRDGAEEEAKTGKKERHISRERQRRRMRKERAK